MYVDTHVHTHIGQYIHIHIHKHIVTYAYAYRKIETHGVCDKKDRGGGRESNTRIHVKVYQHLSIFTLKCKNAHMLFT